MKYTNELEIKKALGIDTWRNLSKDKMLQFAAMMPDMDKEVSLKLIEQFSTFKEFALETVNTIEKAQEAALADNRQSQDRVHQSFQQLREILKDELKNDLSWEQRSDIYDRLMDLSKMEFTKDSENKKFLKELVKYVGVTAVSAVALGIVFVGGKVALGGGDSEEGSGAT